MTEANNAVLQADVFFFLLCFFLSFISDPLNMPQNSPNMEHSQDWRKIG